MEYILHYDYAALMIIVAIMLHFFIRKNINTWQNRVFVLLVILTVLSIILDVLTVFMYDYALHLPLWLNYAVNAGYLFALNGTPVVYYTYIVLATRDGNAFSGYHRLIILLPVAADIVALLLTPWTGWVFYFDEGMKYLHGPLFVLLYAISAVYVLMSLIHTIRHRMKLNMGQKISVYAYTVFCFLAVIFQMNQQNILIIQFAVTIAVLLIYLSLENPESYTDRQLGVYNRIAFTRMVSWNIGYKRSFDLLGIRIDGYKHLGETLGMESAEILLRKIAEYLTVISRTMSVFYLSGEEFAIMSDHRKAEMEPVLKLIRKRFDSPFFLNGAEVSLSVRMCIISFPANVSSLEDVADVLEYSLLEQEGANDEVLYVDENILKKKKREKQILQIVKEAVMRDGFEVYYQPIYSVEKQRFASAEALVRLYHKDLGFISPEEFIPMAEKNGMILEIGEYVFRSVCKMLEYEKPWEYGIDYIEVNLSVVQCMQEKMHAVLTQIMDECQVPYCRINLEITETAAVISSDTLRGNMLKLLEKGVTFSMDDYGTGFSNTATLITYPFHLIKLDKSMVWSAMESPRAMCALKYTAAMIKEMGMSIVAEGVETYEQAAKLEKMGCDYFQGYYYSKPVPEERFLELIKGQNFS